MSWEKKDKRHIRCSPFCHKVLEVTGEDTKRQFGGWLRRKQELKIIHWLRKDVSVCSYCGKNRHCSDLIDNVVQKFKDGHGRSAVHPRSCGKRNRHNLWLVFFRIHLNALVLILLCIFSNCTTTQQLSCCQKLCMSSCLFKAAIIVCCRHQQLTPGLSNHSWSLHVYLGNCDVKFKFAHNHFSFIFLKIKFRYCEPSHLYWTTQLSCKALQQG